jgi:hypothetical protein
MAGTAKESSAENILSFKRGDRSIKDEDQLERGIKYLYKTTNSIRKDCRIIFFESSTYELNNLQPINSNINAFQRKALWGFPKS